MATSPTRVCSLPTGFLRNGNLTMACSYNSSGDTGNLPLPQDKARWTLEASLQQNGMGLGGGWPCSGPAMLSAVLNLREELLGALSGTHDVARHMQLFLCLPQMPLVLLSHGKGPLACCYGSEHGSLAAFWVPRHWQPSHTWHWSSLYCSLSGSSWGPEEATL